MKKLLYFAVLLSALIMSVLFSAVPYVSADADNNVPAESEEDPIIGNVIQLPIVIPASKESDFFGVWHQKYVRSDSEFFTIYEYNFSIYVSISSGYLFWENKNSHVTASSDTYLRNGKLYTDLATGDGDEIVYELNDNGWISASWSGATYYFEKESDRVPSSAKKPGKPVLTVSSHEVKIGDQVHIGVSASGADHIKLYVNGNFVGIESQGGHLDNRFASNSPATMTYYAEAYYDGKPVKSNEETVRFVEPSAAVVESPAPEESHAATVIETPIREESHAEIMPEASSEPSETDKAAAPAADAEKGISLSVENTDVPVGSNASLTVNAPGADGIKIYRSDTNQLMKKSEGDHLDYQFTAAEAKTMPLYAIGSYGGVWSDERSNEVTIRFY